MAETIHPFYEQHRGAMEAAMRERLDLAETMLRERAHLTDIAGIRQEVMDEFAIVLTQMPYVGGAASRMSDFFMRLMGFMAISRVLRRGPNVPVTDINNPQASARSRPLVGLQVLSGFTRRGSQWVDGRAYDPKSGRSYNARLTPNPDGTLTVTGCLLFICQSQSWRRAP